MYKVLIVDDSQSSRELLKHAVNNNSQCKLLNSLTLATEALDYIRSTFVDLIIMDIYTGGKEMGIKISKEIKSISPKTKIIIVTFMVQQEHINLARQYQIEGFWYKDYSTVALSTVIDKVLSGETVYPDKLPDIQIGLAKTTDFTKQELKVLKLKVNGYSHQEICDLLFITRSTLNYHIGNLKAKTGYNDLLQLVVAVSSKRIMIAEELFEEPL